MFGGKIFSVEFIKKDGSLRRMVCRTGVKRYEKGTGLPYNPLEKGLLPVFDMQKRAYRFVNLKTIQRLKYAGTTYEGRELARLLALHGARLDG